jgi:hypothetical protein
MELFVGRDLIVFALLVASVVLVLWVVAATRGPTR